MADPATQAMLGGKAYADANRAIFMNDNAAVTAYTVLLGYLGHVGTEGSVGRVMGKFAEKTGNYLFPIVKIPTNFVAEAGSYGLGGVKALGQVIAAKGTEHLTPDQADYIMRNLKKQSVGAVIMALGYLNPNAIGGYYQQGDNKDLGKVKAGDMKVWGVTVPKFLIHNPAMEMLQLGATIRRVTDKKQSAGEGVFAAAKGLALDVPFFDTPGRIGEGLKNYSTAGKFLGNEVRGAFIPPDVQNIARMQDGDRVRKPKNFTQAIESGIPGLRQNVPTQ